MSSLDALLSPQQTKDKKRCQINEKTACWLILLVAFAIRFAQLDAQSLTMDEVKDLEIARSGWAAIGNSEDRFPPLYHLLLHGWLEAAPWDVTGRGFSALCGVLTVAVALQLGTQIGGVRAGLWTGAIAAASPFAVWYSLESRAYGLYQLLGAIAILQFTRALHIRSVRSWLLFAIAALAGVYVHYYSGLLIACAGILFVSNGPRGSDLCRGLTAFSIIAAGCIPAWFLLQSDLDQPWGYAKTTDFSLASLGYTYFSYLSGYALGPSLRDLHAMPAGQAVKLALPWAAIVGAAVAALLWAARRSRHKLVNAGWAAWFIALCVAPPAIVGAACALTGIGYNPRHALWACIPLYAALGVGAAQGGPAVYRMTAAAVLFAAFGVAQCHRVFSVEYRNEDLRAAARYLASDERINSAPIFVLSGYMSQPLNYYLPESRPSLPLPDAMQPGAAGAPAKMQAVSVITSQVRADELFWIVYTREFHGDPQGRVLAELEHEFALMPRTPQPPIAGVKLYFGKKR